MGHSDKIVSLDEFRAQAMPRLIRQVEGYWDGLRDGRLVPDRSVVDPRGLNGALSHTFLLERIAPGHGRVRIAGRHLSDLMGHEVRGLPVASLFEPEARTVVSDALAAVCDEPAVVEFDLLSPAGFGRSGLRGNAILLPLRSDLGDVSRILGCLVTEGPVGRTPRRLLVSGQRRRTLIGYGTPHGLKHERRDDKRPASADILRLVPPGD